MSQTNARANIAWCTRQSLVKVLSAWVDAADSYRFRACHHRSATTSAAPLDCRIRWIGCRRALSPCREWLTRGVGTAFCPAGARVRSLRQLSAEKRAHSFASPGLGEKVEFIPRIMVRTRALEVERFILQDGMFRSSPGPGLRGSHV